MFQYMNMTSHYIIHRCIVTAYAFSRCSRFGKYTEMHYSIHSAIAGCSIKQYLLEKSRIVSQQENEVFYPWLLSLSIRYFVFL